MLVHGKEYSDRNQLQFPHLPLHNSRVHTSRKGSYAQYLIHNVSSDFVAERVPTPSKGSETLNPVQGARVTVYQSLSFDSLSPAESNNATLLQVFLNLLVLITLFVGNLVTQAVVLAGQTLTLLLESLNIPVLGGNDLLKTTDLAD